MKSILHICAGWQQWNGAANIARMIMGEQKRAGHEVASRTWASIRELCAADEVWIHCGWLPCLWWAAVVCFLTQRRRGAERVLKWMPEACYDPVRLKYHGWKKWLVGPVERWCLRRCDRIVATCAAEKGWIRAYIGKRCPPIEVTDIKRFFDFSHKEHKERKGDGKLHLLYLGRRHPLKGLEFLESALEAFRVSGSEFRVGGREIVFRAESNVFGEEKEKVWEWCDVLVLPTLSENFGLVVAEALERGKCVITTDGAPAWGEELEFRVKSLEFRVEGCGLRGEDIEGSGDCIDHAEKNVREIWSGYGGRLLYLKGYRDGSKDVRVKLLQWAIRDFCSHV